MSFTLRPYQKRFVKNLAREMLELERVIACAPTGSGKSKIMASIATKAVSKNDKVVLVITEAKKIYDQLKEDIPIIDINAGVKDVHIQSGKIYLAMAQTLARRPEMIAEFVALGYDLIVMNDEAHIGTATKVLSQFLDKCYLLGFTATPDYRAAKHLPVLYNGCVQACEVDELIQEGFLCTYRHIARDKANLDILEMRGADFSEESQEEAFSSSEVYDGLIEDLAKYPFKKAMVFCASIKSCEETYQLLLENGIRACRYHSGNKDYPLKNPDYELAKFMELNLCNVCVSVATLTKGFDFPPVDLVCLFRKTASLPLYLQMIGRGSRPVIEEHLHKYPFMTEPKKSFIVLDYGSHWKTLGLYWDDRDWSTMWQPPKTKRNKEDGGGVASVKMCESCLELIAVQARVCPACGYEYPEAKKELEIGESIEVTACYTDLIGRLTSDLSPYELSIYARIKNKKSHAIRIAMYHESNSPGFVSQFAKGMGYKSDWISATVADAIAKPVRTFHDIELR